jgi:hypothetical protein
VAIAKGVDDPRRDASETLIRMSLAMGVDPRPFQTALEALEATDPRSEERGPDD